MTEQEVVQAAGMFLREQRTMARSMAANLRSSGDAAHKMYLRLVSDHDDAAGRLVESLSEWSARCELAADLLEILSPPVSVRFTDRKEADRD